MSNLDNGSVRLAVCKRHKGLLQDVQYDIASCFTSLAGLIHKSVDGTAGLAEMNYFNQRLQLLPPVAMVQKSLVHAHHILMRT